LTTHIGLIDAIGRIDPDLVVRRFAAGARRWFVPGSRHRDRGLRINPHAGETGCSVAARKNPSRRGGAHARPVSTPSVRCRLTRRSFGRQVTSTSSSRCHDQGHCPVKVLGLAPA
jgi:4-hydroxythreonine-4-phosphate dehydrogenase